MKFEFALDVKGVPTANVHVALECSAEELVTLISDPVYQGLGQKFINEVSFKPLDREPAQQKAKSVDTVEELCNRVSSLLSSLKKEREMNEKLHQTEREVVSELNRQITRLAERNSKF